MAKRRYLENAPLTEALIDIRVVLPSTFTGEELRSLSEQVAEKYPDCEARQKYTTTFGVDAGKPFSGIPEDEGLQAFICKSADKKDIAQFRLDGFSYSRLHPYSEWETVLSEAKRLWELYSAVSSPDLISRIAVRYINRLDLPSSLGDFADYLTAPPIVPEALPQGLSQFLTRIVIHEGDMTAHIVQTLAQSPKADHVGVILDIDVWNLRETGFEESSIWPEFEILREFKNRAFFGSITEETARMYE